MQDGSVRFHCTRPVNYNRTRYFIFLSQLKAPSLNVCIPGF